MRLKHFIVLLFVIAAVNCKAPLVTTSEVKNETLHIIVTMKNDVYLVNRLIDVFSLIKKADKMNIYYPESFPNTVVVDCKWLVMEKKEAGRIKKYCESMPEKITVEYAND
ncbi:MAG: hypothetical protein V4539_06670 [Bacteroidota bacterium]